MIHYEPHNQRLNILKKCDFKQLNDPKIDFWRIYA